MTIYPPSKFHIRNEPKKLRWIDHEYAIELTAYNSQQIVGAQAQLLRFQAASAIVNLQAMGRLSEKHDRTNEHLVGINQNISAANEHLKDIRNGVEVIANRLENIENGIDDINSNLQQINDSLKVGFELIADGLREISSELVRHTQQLTVISQQLRRPYEMQAGELRDKAEEWLKHGEESEGQDQTDNWNDALSLYQATIDNHIGRQDYVAWFQIGWLRWKHLQNFSAAAEAFNTARRLSAPKRDLYYLKSLRHLAYMQYLLGHPQDAYVTIQQAYNQSHDHDTTYDYARYAAKTGRNEQAIQLLDQCIELRPVSYVTMFAEGDFSCLR